MSYKPGDTYYNEFTVQTPSTGAAVNADSLPVATANHNGTDDATFTLTVTNLDTGRYKISGTIPTGYAAGDTVTPTIAATVGGVTGKLSLGSFVLDAKRLADVVDAAGNLKANVMEIAGQTVSASAPVTFPASIGTSTYAGADTPGTTTLLSRVPTFPANFSSLTIDATSGGVTVKANNDKTGYALATAPPTAAQLAAAVLKTPGNLLATDINGNVTVGGYATNQDPGTLTWGFVVVNTLTASKLIQGAAAAIGAPYSGLPGTTIVIAHPGDTGTTSPLVTVGFDINNNHSTAVWA